MTWCHQDKQAQLAAANNYKDVYLIEKLPNQCKGAYIDGSAQDCSNSSVLAMEPSTCENDKNKWYSFSV